MARAVYSKQTGTYVAPGTYGTSPTPTYISKAEGSKGEERYVGTTTPTSVPIDITGNETASDIIKANRSVGGGLETQKQIAEMSVKQSEWNRYAQATASKVNAANLPTVSETPIQQKQQATRGFDTGRNEEVYNVLTRKNGKTETTFRSKSLALMDYNELTPYQKADVKVGGILPGGVTRQQAKTIWYDMQSLSSEKERKELSNIRKLGIGSAIIGTAGLAIPLSPFVGIATKTIVNPKNIGVVSKSIGITTGLGVGTFFAAEGIRYGKKVLSYGEQEKQALSNPTTKADINKMIGAGRENVKTTNINYGSGATTGLRENIIDYISYNLPFGKTEEGATFGRTKAFEIGARQKGIELGYKGGELDMMTALSQSERVGIQSSYIGGFIGTGVSSELMGGNLVKKYSVGITGKSIASKILSIKSSTKAIAVAGAGEGFALKVLSYTSGKDKTYKTPQVLYDNPITWAIGGAVSAGTIGGKIAALDIGGQGKKSTSLLYGAYATDLGEGVSDKLADFGRMMVGSTSKRTKMNIPVGAFSFTYTNTPTQTNIFTSTKTKSNSYTSTTKYTPVNIKTSITTLTTVPTIQQNNIPVQKKRKSLINSIINTKTTTPTDVIIPSNVPSIINTPTNVPSIINTPSNVPSIINTNVPATVTTAVNTPATVTVPTFKFPFILPFGGGSGGRGSRGFGIGRVRGKYTPSLIAQVYNIKAKKKPLFSTGVGIRPILV